MKVVLVRFRFRGGSMSCGASVETVEAAGAGIFSATSAVSPLSAAVGMTSKSAPAGAKDSSHTT